MTTIGASTPSPSRRSGSTSPNSSTTTDPGGTSRTSKRRPPSGCPGSTATASTARSTTSPQSKSNNSTTLTTSHSKQWPDTSKQLSGHAGAIQIDLSGVAAQLGIEILVEAEDGIEPTDEFELGSENPRKPFITSCLHAVCTDQASFDKLLKLWRAWKSPAGLPYGYAALRELFTHLKDVRPWGPQDRLASIDWDEYFEGRIDDRPHSVEIELWYRRSHEMRTRGQQEITTLIEQAGGAVTSTALIDQIGYHGLKCILPTQVLRELSTGNNDAVRLIRSTHVMYLRVAGQSLPVAGPPSETRMEEEPSPAPTGNPVLCLFDGVPAANHPLLRERVHIYDPDDLASQATVEELRHGTWMSSVAVWGDRATPDAPAARPVLVRPVLTPADDTIDRVEELPADVLVPDLMWRAFRELFDGSATEPAAAPSIAIINISLGDPAAPFDTIMSSWARMIDWLSYEYGVLVIVSAGNHPRLQLAPSNSAEIIAATGDDRRKAVLDAIHRQQSHRRLLAPAESVNAVAVGAVHADDSSAVAQGYVFDPTDGLPAISPISPTGSGYRRSIKPDLATNGGRVFFRGGITPEESISFAGVTSIGPGIKVATPHTVPGNARVWDKPRGGVDFPSGCATPRHSGRNYWRDSDNAQAESCGDKGASRSWHISS